MRETTKSTIVCGLLKKNKKKTLHNSVFFEFFFLLFFFSLCEMHASKIGYDTDLTSHRLLQGMKCGREIAFRNEYTANAGAIFRDICAIISISRQEPMKKRNGLVTHSGPCFCSFQGCAMFCTDSLIINHHSEVCWIYNTWIRCVCGTRLQVKIQQVGNRN